MTISFPESAPAANPVFHRTYSRKVNGKREYWAQVVLRNVDGLEKLGLLSRSEVNLIISNQLNFRSLPAGRWLWVGGTDWISQPSNYSGAYNCTSTNLEDWEAFAQMMDLAMMGSGTGAIIEPRFIDKLPEIRNTFKVEIERPIGVIEKGQRSQSTFTEIRNYTQASARITVGDSRQGWVDAYHAMLNLASSKLNSTEIRVTVDLGHVRPAGEPLAGFGGTANPVKLPDLFQRVADIFSKAQGRKLTALECCLLIDEAASVVVAGNIRRSAGMRQFAHDDESAKGAKDNLWCEDEHGNWRIDPERDALRMANHTHVYHTKPSLEVIRESVAKQLKSGEGAIQYAPEAIARANCDILWTEQEQKQFISYYVSGDHESAAGYLKLLADDYKIPLEDGEIEHRMNRYGLNPCGEIIGTNFHCNLAEVHLNQINPYCLKSQAEAFEAAGLSVAVLLHHRFKDERYRRSREIDPIVGVSFTGLFDFFAKKFGLAWLKWWEAGRPETEEGFEFKRQEAKDLAFWKHVVQEAVADYCGKHGLRIPNRCTTVQPAGTKSLLTGASNGWHPPKAQRFIRRITFGKNDPVALACMRYGYSVIPGQGNTDENGVLLNDPFDPRCTEWLVEIPTAVDWADIPGADEIDIHKFSALAQFDFYMQVQKFYTGHNTSATIELRKDEIDALAERIHQAIENDEGYISAALLGRFDDTQAFPRLPFEPIDRETYERLHQEVLDRRVALSDGMGFGELLERIDAEREAALVEPDLTPVGPAGCDGDRCLLPLAKPA
jgi:ribonucleotide reductase class II